jgi:AcrR family transcriptional regulator
MPTERPTRSRARSATRPARPRGRPRAGAQSDAVRERLLATATRLWSERGYSEVGIREIARAADVTTGMIAYYFGDKLGLYEAIFDGVFERLLAQLQALAADPPREVEPIEVFVHLYVRTIAGAPWIPQFILREVVLRDGPLRRRFIERFARRAAAVAPALFAREIASGHLRADLDPQLTLVSVIALCIFPFVGAPLFGPVLGIEIDERFPDRLIAHNVRLLLEGVRPRGGVR